MSNLRMSFFSAVLPVLLLTATCLRAEPPGELHITKVIPLLEENSMGRWKTAPFGFESDTNVWDGVLSIGLGAYLTGVVWKGEPPARMNYEIELEARKVFGNDFFLGLTIPVGDSHCTWICGGWGGTTVGISSINGIAADQNETTVLMDFEKDRWYRFRTRVIENYIRCWIDGERVIDLDTRGKELGMRYGEIEQTVPLGITTYDTEGEYRNIVWRNLGDTERRETKINSRQGDRR